MTGTSAPRIPSGDPRRPAMPPTATPHKKGSGEERERKRERRSEGEEKRRENVKLMGMKERNTRDMLTVKLPKGLKARQKTFMRREKCKKGSQ